jgi:hypothetical protein
MDMNFNSDKVYCTKCGTANKAGYRFCVKCGTKLMTPVARSQAEEVQDIPQAEPAKVEPVKAEPTFSAFEQDVPVTEPVKAEPEPTFSAFEAEPNSEYSGFARSGFAGTTTPTAAAGAFATAVEAVKNNKQIDVSDAETVMSLLEQGESSALAKGLPAWDIVPPQVVVRRKHRV